MVDESFNCRHKIAVKCVGIKKFPWNGKLYLTTFVLCMSEITTHQTLLSAKRDWTWTCKQQMSFENLKNALKISSVLTLYDLRKNTIISAGPSSYGLGAALRQQGDKMYRLVAYASKILTEVAKKKSLVVVWVCERFQDIISELHVMIEKGQKHLV